MGTSALSDMYAQSPRAAGPRPEGIRIRQSMSVHVKTNMLHFQHTSNTLKSAQNLMLILPSVYIVFLEQSIVHMHHFPRLYLNVNWLTFSCSPGISGMRYTWFMYTSDFL